MSWKDRAQRVDAPPASTGGWRSRAEPANTSAPDATGLVRKAGSFNVDDPNDPAYTGNAAPKEFRGAGASGGWDAGDPGLPLSLLTKFNQGSTKDSSDEAIGLLARLGVGPKPERGQMLRLPDGSIVPMETPEDVQRGARDYVRMMQLGADQHHKYPGMAAQMLGEGMSDFVLAGKNMMAPAYQTAAGAYRGPMGNNTADFTRPWTPGTFVDAGMSTGLGAGLGYGFSQLPNAMRAAGESEIAQTLANSSAGQRLLEMAGKTVRAPGAALDFTGDKLKDLAGYLKVKSISPNPKIAEAMAELPGGTTGVGRTLLDKGLGGLTKNSTAKQIAAALADASGNIDRTAAALDATGAPGPDLSAISSRAVWRDAVPQVERPLTRATGQRLGDTLSEYQNIYDGKPQTFTEGLNFRRELDDAVYKNDAFGASPEASDFGKSLKPVRGDVNSGLLQSAEQASPDLAEQFRSANLETRQLGMASRAAERAAGRGAGNHVISLKDMLAAGLLPSGVGAGLYSGHVGLGVGGGLGSWLLARYGSQLGARSLYTLGDLVQSPLRNLAAPAAQEMMSRGSLMDLLESASRPMMQPVLASGGGR